MGIYLFKRKALFELLTNDLREDFGKHLIPTAIQSKKVAAFLYTGFWEDIGTIESFYNANISLTRDDSPFNLSNEIRPIFSRQCDLTPAKLSNTRTNQSIFCEGSYVKAEEVKNSIIGPRSVIEGGTIIHDSYVLGNDYYTSTKRDYFCLPELPIIGNDCILKKVIVDKNVRIGNGVQLINSQNIKNYDSENIFIRDGIIIVARGATIPDGYII
jgi:glucose-1-phosphate adenylyltransferase